MRARTGDPRRVSTVFFWEGAEWRSLSSGGLTAFTRSARGPAAQQSLVPGVCPLHLDPLEGSVLRVPWASQNLTAQNALQRGLCRRGLIDQVPCAFPRGYPSKGKHLWEISSSSEMSFQPTASWRMRTILGARRSLPLASPSPAPGARAPFAAGGLWFLRGYD